MNPVDAGNPYQAPETSVAALRLEVRRPPVYTAISLFCWVVGVPCLLASLGAVAVLALPVAEIGWRGLFAGNGPRMMLIASLGVLGAITYICAGRLLWARRGTPGMSLCGFAIALSYFAAWLIVSR